MAEQPTVPATSIYRQVFVGREAELGRLQAAYEAAVAGHGELVLVVGEPGAGKTALTEQLATHVTAQGGRVLAGHCYEAGALSLPYLPFVEALRSYVLAREETSLRHELGTSGSSVARLVPELTERIGIEAVAASGDPETERYRLFQAVTSFLRAAGATQPLVLVLEDLHDADRGTLDLLTYLSYNLAGARLLVVGTYRDVEVGRTHPLSAALAELRRASSVSRLPLRGLSATEVQQMLSAIAEQEVAPALAETLQQQTEGNPLFVQEVIRYLVEAGLIAREGREGRWRTTGRAPLTQAIPEGLRDVIGKRLSRLSPECNRVLAVAAVIGRDFDLSTLGAVALAPSLSPERGRGETEEALFDALEEAVRVAVLEERPRPGGVAYRFTHALLRQTLYEELSAPRRLRLHQQIARVLEQQYAVRLEEHAAELAEHFAHSTDADDLDKAVRYGKLAAERAAAFYAYGEAARLLEHVLEVQAVLDPGGREGRCDLLLSLAEALSQAGEPRQVLDRVAPEAYALAEALGDAERASRACERACWALFNEGAGPSLMTPEAAAWAERAARWARPGTAEQVRADLLGGSALMRGDPQAGEGQLARALGLARTLDEPELRWQAALLWFIFAEAPRHDAARLPLAEELECLAPEGVRVTVLLRARFWQGTAFLQWGRRARAEASWREALALAERTGQANTRLSALLIRGLLATLEGKLEEAVALGSHAAALGEELGLPAYGRVIWSAAAVRAFLYLGRAEELLQRSTHIERALCLAHLGRAEETRALLDEEVVHRPGVGTAEDETSAQVDYHRLEAAVLVGHREAASLLLRRLGERPPPVSGWWYPTCPARHLGAAAALLGDHEAALRFTEQALRDAEQARFRPELALAHLQMAEFLAGNEQRTAFDRLRMSGGHEQRARAGDLDTETRAAVLGHLDFATSEFRAMRMQPALEQALRLQRELLQAANRGSPVAEPPSGVPDGSSPSPLSPREREVLRLLVQGKSNQAIADELIVSLPTVISHVSHIFAKLGASNRAEAAAYAVRHHLAG